MGETEAAPPAGAPRAHRVHRFLDSSAGQLRRRCCGLVAPASAATARPAMPTIPISIMAIPPLL